MLLREQGARVIKIEQPGIGDYYRALHRTVQGGAAMAASSGEILGGRQVHVINQGKETIGLDLKSAEGRDIFKKLVRKADVVIESFRPQTMKRLGIDHAVLKKINPKLILCSISGAGQKGRLAGLAGHDLNYLGLSGLLLKIKGKDCKPVVPDFQVVDLTTGHVAAMQILGALLERGRSKKGRWIDCSLLETANLLARYYPPRHRSFLGGGLLRYGIYETADGGYMSFAPLEPKFWEKFCHKIGQPDWANDPLGSGQKDADKMEFVKQYFKSKTKKELTELGRNEDICLFPVEEIDESLFKGMRDFSPLGAQSVKILKSLGYSAGKIRDLKKMKVVE